MVETSISRSEFLKLLGLGATGLAWYSTFGVNNFLALLNKQRKNGGRHSLCSICRLLEFTCKPAFRDDHCACCLIEGGKVFWLMGSGNNEPHADGPYRHGTWNPDGSFGSTNSVNDDLFCCGMTTLANGNILLCGGTLDYDHQTLNGKFHGGKYAYEVDFSSGSVGNRTEMAHGRWYPTCITLPDGKVFVVQGWDEYGCNNRLIEFYDPGFKVVANQT